MSVRTLIRRCAWCGRVWSGKEWKPSAEAADPGRETSTICPHCVEALVASRRSAT